jgi:hypothetical protein
MVDQATVILPVLLDDSQIPKILSSIFSFDLRHDRQNGIKKIVEFFKKETEGSARIDREEPTSDRVDRGGEILLNGASRRQLRLVASRCVDNQTLQAYCFEEDIAPADLAGESLSERLLSLLHLIARERSLSAFTRWLSLSKKNCVEKQIKVLKRQGLWQ